MDIETYAEHIHFHDHKPATWLIDLIKSENPQSIADLGCGDGAVIAGLNHLKLLNDRQVTAIDASQTRIDRLKKLLPTVRAELGDVCDLRHFSDQSFDLIISNQVIEHVADESALLREALRLLKPGGTFYLSTVFKKWYGWYFYRNNGHWRLDPTHVREYESDGELLPKLEAAGFQIVRSQKTLFYYPIMDFVLKRLGGSNLSYRSRALRALRAAQVPILGYYNWELILRAKG